ncbi:MAG: DNA alkylation repair protein [Clostridiales bacterium]|nr:DNA alkylation repair protein [Clostridiales bacterium]MBR6254861.1 DNA alkylation repair protein [Clostridiales bacterium]
MAIKKEIRDELKKLADEKYREMQKTIIPTADPDSIIGVRTPELRKMAKALAKRDDVDEFLSDLPHKSFDENQLHAFVLSEMKDYDACMEKLNAFLPYVDNWATCDQMSPKIFKKHKDELLKQIKVWLKSKETYTIRFAIGMLMEHFLDADFDPAYPKMVSKIRSEEYYINMMIAWYFATALAKQYDAVLPYIEEKKLSDWTHNKAIQKSVESYRITDEQKAYLKTLKVKNTKK